MQETTDRSSPKFVRPGKRVATFDQDGTLWIEQPMYTQVQYRLDRVPEVVKAMPELRNREPFKTVLSGARAALAKLSRKDLETILGAVLSGMSIKQFRTEVEAWLAQAKQPRWNRPYAELIYQPMLQLLQRLYDEAQKKGWTVISMKKDWKRVFPFE